MITQSLKKYRLACKVILFIFASLPIMLLVIDAFNNNLGPDPAKAMAHITGEWAMRLLLATLTISPLKQLSGSSEWMHFRRMLGLFTFFYASLHLLTYIFFLLALEWSLLWADIVERPYITVGFLAWLILLPLAITSTKNWQRRLGWRWSSLHQWIYAALLLVLFHLIWQVRSDLGEALVYVCIAFILMVFRRRRLAMNFKRLSQRFL